MSEFAILVSGIAIGSVTTLLILFLGAAMIINRKDEDK